MAGRELNDDSVSETGTVSFQNLEGGFWAIRGDNNRIYDPTNLPADFQRENLAVRFTGKLRRDMASIHMMGDIIELTSIQRR
jgi:inhibitor of cysteine peptidase